MLAIHRHLLMQLVVRDVAGRYKGSIEGLAWTVIQPVLMLAVYLFVFGLVFNPRRGAAAPPATSPRSA
jgi:lipopolysaccharide transport system permease protein